MPALPPADEPARTLNAAVVSTDGMHLGHLLPDDQGARFCINLCCVAGHPDQPPVEALPAAEGLEKAWPTLTAVAATGPWSGTMHYVAPDSAGDDGQGAGPEAPAPPLTLPCTLLVSVACGRCTVRSSAVLPGGAERTVVMEGELPEAAGGVARLERTEENGGGDASGGGGDASGGGRGPVALLLSEPRGMGVLLAR